MKYRKKPIVIDAIVWDGSPATANEFLGFGVEWEFEAKGSGNLLIQTLEGRMRVLVGDYIIRGVKGEVYPLKPDIFTATYEPAAPMPEPTPGTPNPTIGDGWQAMPHYRARKEVRAVRIADLQVDHQGATITPEEGGIGSFRVGVDFVAEFHPEVGGYYVVGSNSVAWYLDEYRFVSEFSKATP